MSGINTQSILGISAEHDAGIALLTNGRLSWAANEERYSRIKFQTGWPKQALTKLNEVLKRRGESWPTEIAVASTFHIDNKLGDWQNLDWQYELLERVFSQTGLDRFLWGSERGIGFLKIVGKLQQIVRVRELKLILAEFGVINPHISFVDHHSSHAAAAYYSSGWSDCLVITQDASGDGACSKVFTTQGGTLHEAKVVPFFHSPGHYYEYVTLMFGFKIGREGKVTGLAARGSPDKTFPIFWRECSYDQVNTGYFNHALYRKPEMRRLQKLLAGFSREDIAAGVQKHLEIIMTSFVGDMITKFGAKKKVKLAVSGGIFANVRLNQKIAALPQVSSLWVYPHMGDGGLAAGAAWWVAGQRGEIRPRKLELVYLGDSIIDSFATGPVRRVSRGSLQSGASPQDALAPATRRRILDKLALTVAKLLAQGKVIAVVRGAMEYGPRALGHRSLLVAATDPTVNDWLNKRLKRSEFMPFAPILRKSDVARYFSNWRKVAPSLPFMAVTVDCNDRCRKEAPAIVHVDGTARPQLVDARITPFIDQVLVEYRKLTGLRILINTSFNIHEQPIVRTSEEAIKTFDEGHIDALVLGDNLMLR